MLKDLFDKGKCALGFHEGDWRYVGEGTCQQIRICSRCKAESLQLVHTWGAWEYRNVESCHMARQCARCRNSETKIEHVWGSPVYQRDSSCALVRPCSRCGDTLSAGNAHVWESWIYDSTDNCSQIVACARCGEAGTQKRVAHDWGGWHGSSFYATRVRVCRRCAEMVFDLKDANDVSLQMVDRAVWNIMESNDSETVRKRLSQHSAVLFGPVAEKYFDFAIDQRAPDENTKNTFRQLAELIAKCRIDGIDAVFGPSAGPSTATAPVSAASPPLRQTTPPTGDLDGRLVGHWRHTEAMGSGGFTMAIDTHCLLDGGGRFEWWSKSSMGSSDSGREYGIWSVSGSTLRLKFEQGTHLAFDFTLQGETLFCPREGRYRLWQRVN